MVPILARYGPFFLYSFTVALSLGLLAALGLISRRARFQPYPGWFDAALAGLAGAIIGGRLVFVWVNWPYFQSNLNESWQIWQGGLAYHGCLAGALSALFLWSRRQSRSFLTYADLFAPAAALLTVFGWAACWLEGCAYGRESVMGLFSAALPDSFGVVAVRYQTQVLGIIAALVIFAVALALRGRLYQGQLFWLTLGLLSFSRIMVNAWRGDLVVAVGPMSLTTAVDVGFGLVAAGALAMVTFRAARSRQPGFPA